MAVEEKWIALDEQLPALALLPEVVELTVVLAPPVRLGGGVTRSGEEQCNGERSQGDHGQP